MKKTSLVVVLSLSCLGLARVGVAQPNDPTYSTSVAQARQNIKAEDYTAAEANLKKSLVLAKSAEETSKALVILGEVFYRGKKYEEARVQWSKAIDLGGLIPQAEMAPHLGIAQSYIAEGDGDKAIRAYKVLLDDDKLSRENKGFISAQLADVYFYTQQFARAREEFNWILEFHKDRPRLMSLAHDRIADIYIIEKNYEKALEECNKALNLEGVGSVFKQLAEKKAKLLIPLVQAEKELRAVNKPPQAKDIPSGIFIASE